MQRSPVIPLFSTTPPATIFTKDENGDDSLIAELRSFTTPGALTETIQSRTRSQRTLCSLALFTWNVIPAPFSSQGSNQQPLWSRNLCELALNQWVNAHDVPPNWGMMVLFHTIHFNMLVCLQGVQNFVVAYLNRYGYRANGRHNQRQQRQQRTVNAEVSDKRLLGSLFVSPQERPKAVWHAQQTLSIARRALNTADDESSAESVNLSFEMGTEDREDAEPAPRDEASNCDEMEAPHVPHCVTFAILVLWCNSMLETGSDEVRSKKWPALGVKMLRCSKVYSSHIKLQLRSIFVDMIASADHV